MRYFLLLIVLVFVTESLFSQSRKVIELKSANKMENRIIGGESVRDFVGKVHFVQPSDSGGSVNLWCERALQFLKSGRIDCFGNVKIVRDEMTLLSQEGTYYDQTQSATFPKGVRLERPGSVLTANEGDYDAGMKRAHFKGEVVVVDSISTTTCDDLTYFDADERSLAVGNVRVFSPGEGVTIFGDSLIHYGAIEYTIVPLNPVLLQVDTSSLGRLDTLVVTSRVMEAYRDTSQRYIASDSVMIVRNQVAAQSSHGIYWPQDGILVLTKKPVVWYDENQVSGDSITVRLEEHKLRSVNVIGRAMAVSRSDTSLAGRFDQLTGRELTLYFGDDNIDRIVAERQSISLYYLFEDEKPNGANKSSGDKIVVKFNDGQVEQISVGGGVEGQYVPEQLIRGREQMYDLDGFQWRPRRPRRHRTEIVLE